MTASKMKKEKDVVIANMQGALRRAKWMMRITMLKKYTGPVMEIIERVPSKAVQNVIDISTLPESRRTKQKVWGRIYTGHMRVSLPIIRLILDAITDEQGRPMDLGALIDDKVSYRGDIPLTEEAGMKLGLLAVLHPQVKGLSRVELMAWRIRLLSREEAMYLFTKSTIPAYEERSVIWARSGLRILFAGMQKDMREIRSILENLRE